jgi:hypothetical protein
MLENHDVLEEHVNVLLLPKHVGALQNIIDYS